MRPAVVLAVVALAAFAALAVACGGSGEREPKEPENASLEYKLATINADELVSEDDPEISAFKDVVDSLEGKCPDVRQAIGDMAVTAWEKLGKHRKGQALNLLQVMQDVDRAVPSDVEEASCFQFFEQHTTEHLPDSAPTPTSAPDG